MSSTLIDPLEPGKMKYCSACDNNSATYDGRFLRVPRTPEAVHREWLVRIGIIKRTDPLPKSKHFLVCGDHFDKDYDYSPRPGARLRPRMIPYRNLRTGTYSFYQDLEDPPESKSASDDAPCQCACCQWSNSHPKSLVTTTAVVGIQTDDTKYDGADESGRIVIPKVHCRFCLRSMRDGVGNLRRLFCEDTRQPLDPELIDQLYITTGFMLRGNREPGARICAECMQLSEQAYRFRLQSRSNHLKRVVLQPEAVVYAEQPTTESRAELDPIQFVPVEQDTDPQLAESTIEIWKEEPTVDGDPEPIQFVPVEEQVTGIKVEPRVEPDLPMATKRVKRDPSPLPTNEPSSCPIKQEVIKLEPADGPDGLTDRSSQIRTENNPVMDNNGKRVQIVSFQEFKAMLAKVKVEKKN